MSLKLGIMRVSTGLIIRGKVPLIRREGVAQGNLYSQALVEVLLKVPCNHKPIIQMVGPTFLIALVFSPGR